MKSELMNLIVVLVISIIYMMAAIKVLLPFFQGVSNPMTNATILLFAGVLFGFGLTLHHFSDVASSALHYYSSKQQMMTGVGYWILFASMAFAFSFLVFHLSFQLIGFVTKENEKAELARNNFQLAGIHMVVFIILCIVVTKPLSDLANTLVNYPKFPN
jgi:hypothetical protein